MLLFSFNLMVEVHGYYLSRFFFYNRCIDVILIKVTSANESAFFPQAVLCNNYTNLVDNQFTKIQL